MGSSKESRCLSAWCPITEVLLPGWIPQGTLLSPDSGFWEVRGSVLCDSGYLAHRCYLFSNILPQGKSAGNSEFSIRALIPFTWSHLFDLPLTKGPLSHGMSPHQRSFWGTWILSFPHQEITGSSKCRVIQEGVSCWDLQVEESFPRD